MLRFSIHHLRRSSSVAVCQRLGRISHMPRGVRYQSTAADNIHQLVESISRLSLLETSQLISELKTRLNIQEVAVVASSPTTAAPPPVVEEEEKPKAKTHFSLKLESFDAASKAKIIREVKSMIPGLNLVDAKKLVESAPKVLKENVLKEDAEKLKEVLEGLGAKTRVRRGTGGPVLGRGPSERGLSMEKGHGFHCLALALFRSLFTSQSTQRMQTIHGIRQQRRTFAVLMEDAVRKYASMDIHKITLRDLIRWGQPPLSTDTLLSSARYAHSELPIRLAHRIDAFRRLPFIVGTNPHIQHVHDCYLASFNALTAFKEIRSAEDDAQFTQILTELTERHAENIPKLAKGFLESKNYIPARDTTRFLDDMIRSRIGIRLIAEHHVALHHQSSDTTDYIGILHRRLPPAKLLTQVSEYVKELCEMNYGHAPGMVLLGQEDMTFPYVPVHLEYIACELLKNAYRATVEQAQRKAVEKSRGTNAPVAILRDDIVLPEIEITVSKGEEEVGIRIRDRGGGIPPEDVDAIFEYSYTTVKDEEDGSGDTSGMSNGLFSAQSRLAMQAGVGGPMAGLGYGLPMAQIYAGYFGGKLDLISLDGHGCDVFLQLPSITKVTELEI